MATFALVGCDRLGLSAPGPASKVCETPLGFQGAYSKALTEADSTLLLSPDYGLIHPDEVLSPSDGALGDERWSATPERWLQRVWQELTALRWLEAHHRWLLYAAGEWADRLAGMLQENGQTVDRSTEARA